MPTRCRRPALVALIGFALAFDFLNGLHDASNSIATVVSTRVMRPVTAVVNAAFFNFIACTVFGLHVAQTMGSGVVDPTLVTPAVVFAALFGAIAWNVITWLLGIPSSSSHAWWAVCWAPGWPRRDRSRSSGTASRRSASRSC